MAEEAPTKPPLVQGIKPPGHLQVNGNIADNWKSYKQIWGNYSIITNLTAQAEEYQVHTGTQAYQTINLWVWASCVI